MEVTPVHLADTRVRSASADETRQRRVWLGRGSAAVADQAFSSGANFALSMLLARWVPAAEYGAYAVAFAAFLLVATVFQAALLTPSLTLGTSHYATRSGPYVAAMTRLGLRLAAGSALLLLAAALLYSTFSTQRELAECLAAMAFATPAVLLWWLARSVWYLRLTPEPAAWGSILYALILLSSLCALRWTGVLSGVTGILAMGAAALITGGWLLVRLHPDWRGALPPSEVWHAGWQYGRWEVAIALAAWLPASLCYPVTASVIGDSEAGSLRALQNFALPVTQASTSILRLLQPYLSRRFSAGGHSPDQTVWQALAAVFIAFGLYLGVVQAWRAPLMSVAYGGRFDAVAPLLPWVVLVAVFAAGSETIAMGLRARGASRAILPAFVAAGLVAVGTSVPAASLAGLTGVVASLVSASALSLGVLAWQFHRAAGGTADETLAKSDWESRQ